MAEHSAGFRIYADATQFERGMAQVTRTAGDVGKKVASAFDGRAIGRTLATALGLSLTDIADKAARFWTGFSKDAESALEAMVAATGKAADAQEKALEKLREKKRKQAEEEQQTIWDTAEHERQVNLKLREEIAKSKQEESEKTMDAAEKVREFDRKAAFDRLSDQDKLIKLKGEEADLAKIIREYEADVKKNGYDSAESANVLLEIKNMQADKQREIAALTKQTAVEEKKVTEQVKEQLRVKIETVGKSNDELSDRALAKKAAALRSDVSMREIAAATSGGVFTGGTTQDLLLNPQRAELARVLQEQQTRGDVRRQVRAFGEERAFQMFGGSEQRFQDILAGISEDKELARRTADGITELNNRLKAGIPVVNLNK